ncbi:H(+)/Cl(-) exchange transporter 5 isoform X2 [Parasteatoda tepidariorum]|uniref:H(+)/Cl(-) exchange transporter 5 isoform X2 n=1 Tax=Parasteatoda tepidariorum TaxID=114398 RepID=UPI001C723503|nr:H(+)/Cl(-) exchange transporter 5 isoform X2 [Parasteatoda tepidariorum]
MENMPLSHDYGASTKSYDSTKVTIDNNRLQDIPEQRASSEKQPSETRSSNTRRQLWKRRHSSEGSMIHITGTGTLLEESLNCGQCYKGNFWQRPLEMRESSQDSEDLPPGVGQYDDFHTIDWKRDLSRDSYRHKYITRKMSDSFLYSLKGYCDKLSGWICVFLVGVAAGSVAGFIDIGESWMKDLKEGVCPQAFWLNKEQCCWSSNSTFYEGDDCAQWNSWYTFFNLESFTPEEYLLSYAFYAGWSLFFSAVACTMVLTFAPYACGSGVPEIKTILSGFIMRGYLGKWTLVIKSVATMMAVSSGLSLGKEGPMVHIVCCIGNILSYFFPKYGKNEAKKREVLSAAAAAGVSTAFGAPIGGVLFSLEEVSYYFPMKTLWRSFFCALVAAFVLRSIDPFGTDHVVKYYMSTRRKWILIELIPFIILGIIGVLGITLFTSLISFPNDFTRMNASDLIKVLFSQCRIHDESQLCDYERNVTSFEKHMEIIGAGPGIYKSLYLLLLALFCKFILTIFTFGIKLPTGLFIPSLSMGAIAGRIVGIGMQELAMRYKHVWPFHTACASNENCMAPSLYAMIGAASCLAGVTRMTVSLVVIMFELTGSVDYIVPVMATVVVSKWVGDAMDKEGIYDAHIQFNHYPFLDNKKSFKESTKAVDLVRGMWIRSQLVCFSQKGMTLYEIEDILRNTSHNGFPIIFSQELPYLIGFVLRRDLCLTIEHKKKNKQVNGRTTVDFGQKAYETSKSPFSLNLNKIVDMAPITVTVLTPMETVIEMFCKLGLRQILVTENGKLTGIITKKDVLNHIHEVKMLKKCKK